MGPRPTHLAPRDLDLLEAEIDTQWPRDKRNRLTGAAPHLVLAVANDSWTIAFGSQVPDVVADQLRSAVERAPPSSDSAVEPAVIGRCEDLLSATFGTTEISSGPSYAIPPGTTFPSATEIQRPDNHDTELLLNQDVKRLNWPVDEWRQLLAGELGPWAMAVIDRRVISICHSARLTDRGAEAGVWTDPAFRGQGHAAAVTAAWAALLVDSKRHLFYSTSATNFSSQRVAARLHLRPIGWLWKLTSSTARS